MDFLFAGSPTITLFALGAGILCAVAASRRPNTGPARVRVAVADGPAPSREFHAGKPYR